MQKLWGTGFGFIDHLDPKRFKGRERVMVVLRNSGLSWNDVGGTFDLTGFVAKSAVLRAMNKDADLLTVERRTVELYKRYLEERGYQVVVPRRPIRSN